MSMNELVNEMMNQENVAAQTVEQFGIGVPISAAVAGMQNTPVASVSAVEQTEPIEQKPYEIRPLNARDIFPMTKIIRKIGLKDFGKCFEPEEIKAITDTFSENGEEKNMEDLAEIVGVSVVLKIVDIILEHLPDAGEEVFAFIAGLIGKTKDEVATLPMDVFFELVVDVFKRKEFVGFMKAVSRLVK